MTKKCVTQSSAALFKSVTLRMEFPPAQYFSIIVIKTRHVRTGRMCLHFYRMLHGNSADKTRGTSGIIRARSIPHLYYQAP